MLAPDATTVVGDPLVRCDSDDPAVLHGDDDLPVAWRCGWLRAPRKQATHDLGYFVEPLAGASDIERVELLSVVVACVTKNHASAGSIGSIGPFGVHFFPVGSGGDLVRPPFAKLRFGFTPGASKAVDRRWMVDHRASSRPFSIREISA